MLNRLLARWLEFAVLAALLTVVMVSAVDDVEFHGDEASRIASSYFFETFTDGHLNSPLWDENYWTLTQPPLSRYFIGLGRSAAGYGPEDLNNTWNWYRDVERNIKEGNMPSPGLLWWSRLPMALLTVVSGLALFYLLAAAAGRVAGYVGVLLFTFNSYLHNQLLRALGEAPLLTFVLLAALTTYFALRCPTVGGRARRVMAWLAVAGVMAGLAGASKLNGLVAGVAVVALVPFLFRRWPTTWTVGGRLGLTLAGVIVPLALTALVFVAVNPFLYPDPVTRLGHMIDHRVTEMDKQFGDTQYRFDDPQERVTVLPRRIFGEYASVHFPGSETLYLGLTALGVIGLTWQTWRWLSAGHSNGAGPVIATFTALLAGPSLLTPLDWERYYLFPVAFDILCVAVAVGWLAGLAPRAASATLNGARGLMRRKGDAPLR